MSNISAQISRESTSTVVPEEKQEDIQYCEFCGVPLKDVFGTTPTILRRKYCSSRCRSLAISRLSRARLGVPPPKRTISRLSDPLYFN